MPGKPGTYGRSRNLALRRCGARPAWAFPANPCRASPAPTGEPATSHSVGARLAPHGPSRRTRAGQARHLRLRRLAELYARLPLHDLEGERIEIGRAHL